ncbi:hypothetical protein [Planifilum fimeticola]
MLKQRSKFVTLTFELVEAGVRVEHKTWFGRKAFLVKYETIPTSVSHITEKSKTWFWLGLVSALIGLWVFAGNPYQGNHPVFYLILSLMFWFLFWQSRRKWIGFQCRDGSGLFFIAGNPSDEAVEEFIRRVQEAKEKYLRRHLMGRLGDIYPFVGEMAWTKIYDDLTRLKALDIISDSVFSRLKKEMMDNFEHFTNEKHNDLHHLH